jgi:hypothetical protein
MTKEIKFIQVGELAQSITENVMPQVADLAGRSLQLNYEDDVPITLKFGHDNSLSWKVNSASEGKNRAVVSYQATCPREGIYFVDYINPLQQAESISHILDLEHKIATTIVGTMPTEQETRRDLFSRAQQGAPLTGVNVRFMHACIDVPFSPHHQHAPTEDLIGKRVMYVYSQTEIYEHVYLNENFYTWQCLSGVEKGLADTDRCHYYKIGDNLYLFVWREKIIPTLGVVVIDYKTMKTTGKLCGYESGEFGRLANAPLGAHALFLNETRYPLR